MRDDLLNLLPYYLMLGVLASAFNVQSWIVYCTAIVIALRVTYLQHRRDHDGMS